MTKNFPKLMTDTKPQIQISQRTPSRISTQKNLCLGKYIKLQKIKDKEKILEEAREKNLICKGRDLYRISLQIIMQVWRKWNKIFKILIGENINWDYVFSEITNQKQRRNTFSNKEKFREFVTSIPTLRNVKRSSSEQGEMT